MIEILAKDEIKTRIEAAWVVANLSSGGTPDQIRHLVELNVIPSLCDLLTVVDGEQVEIVEVALNSLNDILKLSQKNDDSNLFAFKIRECGGMDKIECLKSHQNENISHKAYLLIYKISYQDQDKDEEEEEHEGEIKSEVIYFYFYF